MDMKLAAFVCVLVTSLVVSADAARGGGASRGGHAAGHAAGHVVGRAAGHGSGTNGGSKRTRNDDPMKNPVYTPRETAKNEDPMRNSAQLPRDQVQVKNPSDSSNKFGGLHGAAIIPLFMLGSSFSPFASRRHTYYTSRSSNYRASSFGRSAEWSPSDDHHHFELGLCFPQRNLEEINTDPDIGIEMTRWCQ